MSIIDCKSGFACESILPRFSRTDEALSEMIRTYTREAGVRNLEREIAKLARKAVTKIIKKEDETVTVTPDALEDFLGVKKYRYGLAEEKDQIPSYTRRRPKRMIFNEDMEGFTHPLMDSNDDN